MSVQRSNLQSTNTHPLQQPDTLPPLSSKKAKQEGASLEHLIKEVMSADPHMRPSKIKNRVGKLNSLKVDFTDPKIRLTVLKILIVSQMDRASSVKKINAFRDGSVGKHLGQASSYVPTTVNQILPLMDVEVGGEWTNNIKIANLLYGTGSKISKGAAYFYRYQLLNELRVLVDKIKPQLLQKEREEMEAWLVIQEEKFRESFTKYTVETSLSLPGMVAGYASFFSSFTPFIKSRLGLFGAIAGAIGSGLSLKEAINFQKIHNKWIKEQHGSPPPFEPQWEALLKKRRALSKKAIEKALQAVLIQAKNNPNMNGREIHTALKAKGIHTEKTDLSAAREQLLADLENPKIQKQLLDTEIEHRETISQLTKQGLQAVTKNKQETERLFFAHGRGQKTRSLLIVIGYVALAALSLTVAASLGIALTYSGMGLFLLGVASLTYGLWYLKRHKPHDFKCTMQFDYTKRRLYLIPQMWHKLQMERALSSNLRRLRRMMDLKEELKNVEERLKEARAKKAPFTFDGKADDEREELEKMKKSLEKKIEKQQKKYEKTDKEFARRITKVGEWGKKIAPITSKIRNAAEKDIAKATRLETLHTGEALPLVQELAKGLLEGDSKESRLFLKEALDIDLAGIREESPSKQVELLIGKLKEYLSTEGDDLIDLIKDQTGWFLEKRKKQEATS